ncbi:DivIVA domain-containing protein [Nakamurella silvestris]|nr:DivIVA domain-containing protein [Nakamurella silvestris]
MTTVLLYLVFAAIIGGIVFVVAMVFFGRGEQLPALAARTSPAQLPAKDIRGSDVQAVRFSLALRGYRMSDVDWTLERLAGELERTRERVAELERALGIEPAFGSPAGSVSLTKDRAEDEDLWRENGGTPAGAADTVSASVQASPSADGSHDGPSVADGVPPEAPTAGSDQR